MKSRVWDLKVSDLRLDADLYTARCLALVADGECVGNIDYSIFSGLESKFVVPTLHHTFLVLRGHSVGASIDIPTPTDTQKIFEMLPPKYTVTFRDLVPVPTGVLMLGYPSIDIEPYRDILREMGYETGVPRKCDIVHMSLIRWTAKPTDLEYTTLCSKLKTARMHYTLNVDTYRLVYTDWCNHHSTTLAELHM